MQNTANTSAAIALAISINAILDAMRNLAPKVIDMATQGVHRYEALIAPFGHIVGQLLKDAQSEGTDVRDMRTIYRKCVDEIKLDYNNAVYGYEESLGDNPEVCVAGQVDLPYDYVTARQLLADGIVIVDKVDEAYAMKAAFDEGLRGEALAPRAYELLDKAIHHAHQTGALHISLDFKQVCDTPEQVVERYERYFLEAQGEGATTEECHEYAEAKCLGKDVECPKGELFDSCPEGPSYQYEADVDPEHGYTAKEVEEKRMQYVALDTIAVWYTGLTFTDCASETQEFLKGLIKDAAAVC